MRLSQVARLAMLLAVMVLVASSASAQAQAAKPKYEPQVGQEGKDVVWVPTNEAVVRKMLDMANVTPSDFVIDLGSGDGRTVIAAAKRGARALGVEFNPEMVALSKERAAEAGVSEEAQFMKGDLFEADLSQATVITMFLLPDINLKLRPKLLALKPGTRICSNSFTMGEWEADESATIEEGCESWCTALFWVIPAKVDGTWRLADGELTLSQEFQMLSGTLKTGNRVTPITDGRMRGDQITFTAGTSAYTGRLNGKSLQGTVATGSNKATWSATKAGQ